MIKIYDGKYYRNLMQSTINLDFVSMMTGGEGVWKPVHDTVADDIAHETPKDGHVSPEAPIWSHWLWHLWNGYHDHDQYNVDSGTSFVLTINYNAGHDGVDIGDGDDYAVDGETAFVYIVQHKLIEYMSSWSN